MIQKITSIILLSSILISFTTKKDIQNRSLSKLDDKEFFESKNFEELNNLTLQKIILFEKKNNSKDVTLDIPVYIGRSLYPNTNDYNLAFPKKFKRIDSTGYNLDVSYYSTKKDSLIRVITYDWRIKYDYNNPNFFNMDSITIKKNSTYFQTKFNSIKDILLKNIGKPNLIEINSTKHKRVYQDKYKWSKKNANAYLYITGNTKIGFSHVSLIIYKN